MSLGKKLIKYRHEKNLSQPETAQLLGVAQSTYSEWESDKSKPKAESYVKIAQLYRLDHADLIEGKPSINICGDNNNNLIDSSNNKIENTEAILKLATGIEKLVALVESMIDKK